MATLIAVQLETSHANAGGTAWYAYLEHAADGACEAVLAGRHALRAAARQDGAPLGLEFDGPPVEVPSALSRRAGLRRYWVASAV